MHPRAKDYQGHIYLGPQGLDRKNSVLYLNLGNLYKNVKTHQFPTYDREILSEVCTSFQYEDVEREVCRYLERKGMHDGWFVKFLGPVARTIRQHRFQKLVRDLNHVIRENSPGWRYPVELVVVDRQSPVAATEQSQAYDNNGDVLISSHKSRHRKRRGSSAKVAPTEANTVWPPLGCNLVITVPGHRLREVFLSRMQTSSEGSGNDETSVQSQNTHKSAMSVNTQRKTARMTLPKVSEAEEKLTRELIRLEGMRLVGEISEYQFQQAKAKHTRRLEALRSYH